MGKQTKLIDDTPRNNYDGMSRSEFISYLRDQYSTNKKQDMGYGIFIEAGNDEEFDAVTLTMMLSMDRAPYHIYGIAHRTYNDNGRNYRIIDNTCDSYYIRGFDCGKGDGHYEGSLDIQVTPRWIMIRPLEKATGEIFLRVYDNIKASYQGAMLTIGERVVN